MLFRSQNAPAILSALRIKGIKIPGATSALKQKSEFEVLLRQGPMPNPQLLQMQAVGASIQEQAQQAQASGQPVPPELVQQMQQLTQVAQQLPKMVSTIPVAQDESENHAVEANEVFEWMNSTEGQKFKNGTPQQRAGYENCHLHWSEHVAMAKKIAAANKQPDKPPSESISIDVSKMPPPVAVQALSKAGIQATPDMFTQLADQNLNHKVAAKAIPHALEHEEPKPQPQAGGPPQK